MATLPNALSLSGWPVDSSAMVAAPGRADLASIQAAMNSLLATLGGGTAAQVLLSGGGTTVNWGGAYTAYTPTWTATGVAPAIGNAVVVAQYVQLGKMVHAYGRITFGTTSTFGTGAYSFALPVTASANAFAGSAVGVAQMFDSSAAAFGLGLAQLGSTTTLRAEFGATYLGADTLAQATLPWVWAVGDIISWNITYEAA